MSELPAAEATRRRICGASTADGVQVDVPEKEVEEDTAYSSLDKLKAVCMCLFPFLLIVWFVVVVWTLWDTHNRGAGGEDGSLEACPNDFLIWWFLVWFFTLGFTISCCCDLITPSRPHLIRVQLVTQIAIAAYFGVRGAWVWQHMPPACEKVCVRSNGERQAVDLTQ